MAERYESARRSNAKYDAKFYMPKIYLPMEMKEEIKELADYEYLSINKFLARAIMKYCEEVRKEKESE